MEGTFINKNFTWGGDVYKQKFYLGRGRFINKTFYLGTFINKNFTWGGDVYKQNFTWGGEVNKSKFCMGRKRRL